MSKPEHRARALAAIGSVILLVAAASPWWDSPGVPSDATLSARFREHRKEFDALARIAMADTQLVGARDRSIRIPQIARPSGHAGDLSIRAGGRRVVHDTVARR
jgi:hypothetical protein